jgi:hypothetical protein
MKMLLYYDEIPLKIFDLPCPFPPIIMLICGLKPNILYLAYDLKLISESPSI